MIIIHHHAHTLKGSSTKSFPVWYYIIVHHAQAFTGNDNSSTSPWSNKRWLTYPEEKIKIKISHF